MAEPYDTLLESVEVTAMVTNEECTIIAVLGKSYGASTTFSVQYGATDSLGSETATTSLSGGVKGDVKTRTITGSTAIYYRVKIVDGATTTGPTRKVWLRPAYTKKVMIQQLTDSHETEVVSLAQTSRDATLTQTATNMASEYAANDFPRLMISTGDCVPYAKNAPGVNFFPISEDGSSPGRTSPNATGAADCNYSCRLYKRRFASAFAGSMFLRSQGNHDGGQHWHYSANNGAVNDIATLSKTAFNLHFGNPDDTGDWSGDENALWGNYQWGPVLVCILNSLQKTILRTTNPATDGGAKQPDSDNDWTLGQNQWDHFFHATTGVVTTASPATTPFILFCIHNMLGASSVNADFLNYGWGGIRHVDEDQSVLANEVYETGPGAGWTNPYGYSAPYSTLGLHGAIVSRCNANGCKPIVLYGHSHFWARESADGVPYVCTGRACASGSTADYGFRQAGGWWDGSAWTNDDPNAVFRAAGGHTSVFASPHFIDVKYIRSVATGLEPPDGYTTNGSIPDSFRFASRTGKRIAQYRARSA